MHPGGIAHPQPPQRQASGVAHPQPPQRQASCCGPVPRPPRGPVRQASQWGSLPPSYVTPAPPHVTASMMRESLLAALQPSGGCGPVAVAFSRRFGQLFVKFSLKEHMYETGGCHAGTCQTGGCNAGTCQTGGCHAGICQT